MVQGFEFKDLSLWVYYLRIRVSSSRFRVRVSGIFSGFFTLAMRFQCFVCTGKRLNSGAYAPPAVCFLTIFSGLGFRV